MPKRAGSSPVLVNIVDIEATCWEHEPPAGEFSEIIEVGLTVIDLSTHRRVLRTGVLVQPEHSTVGTFCTELTGLRPEQVAGGLTFAAACEWLRDELESTLRPWASWGDYDRHQFIAQCSSTGVSYPFSAQHGNLRRAFSVVYGLERLTAVDEALVIAGLPMDGRLHRGDDDAWNIAALAIAIDRKAPLFR